MCADQRPQAGVPRWLRNTIVLITIPPWAAVIVIEAVNGKDISSALIGFPFGLLVALYGRDWVITVTKRKDNDGD